VVLRQQKKVTTQSTAKPTPHPLQIMPSTSTKCSKRNRVRKNRSELLRRNRKRRKTANKRKRRRAKMRRRVMMRRAIAMMANEWKG